MEKNTTKENYAESSPPGPLPLTVENIKLKASFKVQVKSKSEAQEKSRLKTQNKDGDRNTWTCVVCNKEGKGVAKYKKHMKYHNSGKEFTCTECNKKFKTAGHLEVHSRTHTGERPYMCLVCECRFLQSSHLKTHMLKHGEEKQFSCTKCKKKFRFKNSLTEHMLSHNSDEDKLACDECGKFFINVRRLDYHKKHHRQDSRVQCSLCLATFRDKGYLITHQQQFCGNNGYKKRMDCRESTTEPVSLCKKKKKPPNDEPARGKGRPKGSLGKKKKRALKKATKFKNNLDKSSLQSVFVPESSSNVELSKNIKYSGFNIALHKETNFTSNIENTHALPVENNIKNIQVISGSLNNSFNDSSNNQILQTSSSTRIHSTKNDNANTSSNYNNKNDLQDQFSTDNDTKINIPADYSKTVTQDLDSSNNNCQFNFPKNIEHDQKNPMSNDPGGSSLDKTLYTHYHPRSSDGSNVMGNLVSLDNPIFDQEIPHNFAYQHLSNSQPLDPGYYLENVKDLFNLQNISNMYDPSLLDIQENAQNLSMSVQENLDNMPQNLSVLPQNMSELTHQLSSMENGPQNLVINQNMLNMTQQHNTQVSQASYNSVSHLPTNIGYPQELDSNHLELPQNYSRQNSMSLLPSHVNDSNIFTNQCQMPQNLSLTSNSIAENLSTNLIDGSTTHSSSLKSSLTSQRFTNNNNLMPFNEFHAEFSNPQNLTIQNSYTGNPGQSSRLPLVHDLSVNPSHHPNLNELSVSMTEEVLQPQNLSQSHSCQPENLTVPQNLSASSTNVRRTHCFNQPKNLSIHTPSMSHGLTRDISYESIQSPQNLSYGGHTNTSLMPQQINSRHITLNKDGCNTVPPQHINTQYMSQPYRPSANTSSLQTFTNPMYSTPQMQQTQFESNNLPENLSCHSKIHPNIHHQNTPENLSLASNLQSQPQNLSLPLQPQNLTHKNNYSTSSQMNFVVSQQPQNLSHYMSQI